jgi:glyoxylase-like metal-dependent hydrolase (beta-lactamase superfamily II)
MKYFQVAQGVWGMKLFFANVYMIANRKGISTGWVLVDTGPQGYGEQIIAMAESIFGKGAQPNAIILTHGHSDHAGSVEELLKHWDVPVYAHQLELPYLTKQSAYPPADPSVGHGLFSLLSVFFNKRPIDLGDQVKAIDMEEGIAELPEWRPIFTPGHSPGHISLFFPLNTTLIAGDALATTHAESAIAILGGVKKLSGPPMYSTTDWEAAEQSVGKLTELQPRIIAAGHGPVIRGSEAIEALKDLNANFKTVAVPTTGRYVNKPAAADETGTYYVPPFAVSNKFKAGAVLVGAIAGLMIVRQMSKR